MSFGGLGVGHVVDAEPLKLGGRDDLFVATDRKLDRRVALRVLSPVGDPVEERRFLDDARVLGAVSGHPNVLRVYDVGIGLDRRPYLVMELPDGPDLGERSAASGPRPWTEAVDLALQLSTGLAQVHRVGWLHRDLRPANVYQVGSTFKLSDVGVLPSLVAAPTDPSDILHRAPETFDGEWDQRSDLYALTSILHELIDGRPAFWRPDDTMEAVRQRITSQAPPGLDPEMAPPALRVFVRAGLSPDPLDRPQDAAEFTKELDLIRQGRTAGARPSILHAGSTGSTGSTVIIGPTTPRRDAGPAGRSPIAGVAPALVVAEVGSGAGALDGGAGAWPPPEPADRSPTLEPAGMPASQVDSFGRPAADDERDDRAGDLGHGWWGDPSEPAVGIDRAHGPTPPPAIVPISNRPSRAPGPRPLLLAATALVVVGLVGLVAVLATALDGSGSSQEAGGATLSGEPSSLAPAVDDGASAPSSVLTPLGMLRESTTTTVSPDATASTSTTAARAVVPDLVGLDVEVAGQRLAEAGFEVLVAGRVSPGSVPGTVIQQSPAGGATVVLPATVTVFIPRSATLPFMIARPADTVCQQLTALGLRCERVARFDDVVPAGSVVATDPVEGSAFEAGATVRLDVSLGPLVERDVPQVAGLTEERARAALADAGFISVAVARTPSSSVPAGRAIATEPSAGTLLAIDQPVTVALSSGPALQVSVPDLAGLDRAAAEAALASAQLSGSFTTVDLPEGDPGIGTVVTFDPAAGSQVPAGSIVAVTVGRSVPISTTTTPSSGSSSTSPGG